MGYGVGPLSLPMHTPKASSQKRFPPCEGPCLRDIPAGATRFRRDWKECQGTGRVSWSGSGGTVDRAQASC